MSRGDVVVAWLEHRVGCPLCQAGAFMIPQQRCDVGKPLFAAVEAAAELHYGESGGSSPAGQTPAEMFSREEVDRPLFERPLLNKSGGSDEGGK